MLDKVPRRQLDKVLKLEVECFGRTSVKLVLHIHVCVYVSVFEFAVGTKEGHKGGKT